MRNLLGFMLISLFAALALACGVGSGDAEAVDRYQQQANEARAAAAAAEEAQAESEAELSELKEQVAYINECQRALSNSVTASDAQVMRVCGELEVYTAMISEVNRVIAASNLANETAMSGNARVLEDTLELMGIQSQFAVDSAEFEREAWASIRTSFQQMQIDLAAAQQQAAAAQSRIEQQGVQQAESATDSSARLSESLRQERDRAREEEARMREELNDLRAELRQAKNDSTRTEVEFERKIQEYQRQLDLDVEKRTEAERRRLEAAEAAANARADAAVAKAEEAQRQAEAAEERTRQFAQQYNLKQAEAEERMEALAGCRQQVDRFADDLWGATVGGPEEKRAWMGDAPRNNPYGVTRYYEWRLNDVQFACGAS